MDRDEMVAQLENSMADTIAAHGKLVELGANENAISHHFAIALQKRIESSSIHNHAPPLSVDVEYSRATEIDPATGELTLDAAKYVRHFVGDTLDCLICGEEHAPNEHQGHWVRPDVIVHYREGRDDNIVAIECKHIRPGKSKNKKLLEEWKWAQAKLELYRGCLNYSYAALVVFQKQDEQSHVVELLSGEE